MRVIAYSENFHNSFGGQQVALWDKIRWRQRRNLTIKSIERATFTINTYW